jgi:hypothetical protein
MISLPVFTNPAHLYVKPAARTMPEKPRFRQVCHEVAENPVFRNYGDATCPISRLLAQVQTSGLPTIQNFWKHHQKMNALLVYSSKSMRLNRIFQSEHRYLDSCSTTSFTSISSQCSTIRPSLTR